MREVLGVICLVATLAAAVVLVVALVRRRAASSAPATPSQPAAPWDPAVSWDPATPMGPPAPSSSRGGRRRAAPVLAGLTGALAVAAALLLVPAHYSITMAPQGQVVATPGSRLAVSIRNAGLLSGTLRARVTVDGVAQPGITATVAGGATKRLTLDLPASLTAGPHTVVVSGKALLVTALRPASFHVTELQCVPQQATVHDTIAVIAEVRNEGQASGVFPGELRVDGRTVATQPTTVAGGTVKGLTFKVKRTKPGYYTFRLGDAAPETIPIVKPIRPADGAVLARSTSGDGQLVFKNKLSEDLVAVLSADAHGGRHPALAFYVRAKSSATVDRIADGRLYVYFESGSQWNRTTDGFLVTDDRERFKHSAAFSTSSWTSSYTDWSAWTIYTTEHTRYTQWVISVSNEWVTGPAGGSIEVTARHFPKL